MHSQSQKETIRSEDPLLMPGLRADWAAPGVTQSMFLTWDKEVHPERGCGMEAFNRHTASWCSFLVCAYLLRALNQHIVLMRTFIIL